MLLVLGGVARDRLVAELGELDPHLAGRDDVGPVADEGPVAARHRIPLRGLGCLGPHVQGFLQDGGQLGQCGQHLLLAFR